MKTVEYMPIEALKSLLALMNTPIAQRKGVFIPREDCKDWIELLTPLVLKYEEIERNNKTG